MEQYFQFQKFNQSENEKSMKYYNLIANADFPQKTKNMGTNNKILIENSPYDSYWGIGITHDGKNMLGKLLMEVRFELSQNLY